jgi:hypothetical protein
MIASLVVCHVSERPHQTLHRVDEEEQPVSWVFLCQNYLRLLDWQKALNPQARFLPVGELLGSVAEKLRTPFLDLITELGRRHNSIAWWATRLSERNTMVSPLFLYCCYLKIAQDALENGSGTLCVVGESWEVLESLAHVARERGCKVTWVRRPSLGRRRAIIILRIAKRLAHFLAMVISQQRRDSPRLSNQQRPMVLMRTWVDEGCFDADGSFHDRYMPGLCQWLESSGFSVITIPVLANLRRSYGSAWRWLRDSRQQFLNPFRHYRISDYWYAFRESWHGMKLPGGPVRLEDLEVSRVFDAERYRSAFDEGSLEGLLSYRLPRRLAQDDQRIDILIDLFENMIFEKLLNLGFRRYLPATSIVGFQHGSLFPLLLCLFVTAGEAEFAPIPDRLVCSGEFFRDTLISEGFPSDRALVGPALRYRHLSEGVERKPRRSGDKPFILIPLPLVLDSAVELLAKVVSALGCLPDVRIIVKAHPMSSQAKIMSAASLKELPANFEFVEGSMGELLARSQLVIALSSSTVHETLAAGIPVIVVGREASLDLNPLDWYVDLGQVTRDPEMIRAEAYRLLSLSAEDLAEYQKKGSELLRACFNPVTDKAMHTFVDGLSDISFANPSARAEVA